METATKKNEYFVRIDSDLAGRHDINPSMKLILGYIRTRLGLEGWTFSVSDVSKQLGLSIQTASVAFKTLQNHGGINFQGLKQCGAKHYQEFIAQPNGIEAYIRNPPKSKPHKRRWKQKPTSKIEGAQIGEAASKIEVTTSKIETGDCYFSTYKNNDLKEDKEEDDHVLNDRNLKDSVAGSTSSNSPDPLRKFGEEFAAASLQAAARDAVAPLVSITATGGMETYGDKNVAITQQPSASGPLDSMSAIGGMETNGEKKNGTPIQRASESAPSIQSRPLADKNGTAIEKKSGGFKGEVPVDIESAAKWIVKDWKKSNYTDASIETMTEAFWAKVNSTDWTYSDRADLNTLKFKVQSELGVTDSAKVATAIVRKIPC